MSTYYDHNQNMFTSLELPQLEGHVGHGSPVRAPAAVKCCQIFIFFCFYCKHNAKACLLKQEDI